MEIIKTRANSEPADVNVDSMIKDMKIEISVPRTSKYRNGIKEFECRLAPIKRGRRSAFIDSISF